MNRKLEICLPGIEPITLNTATKYRTQGRFVKSYKSAEYKKLESVINSEINKHKGAIRLFNKSYCDKKTYLRSQYIFYYPILTKAKTLSKTSKDVDNIVKPINDIIFKHLDADDSQVVELNVLKVHSDTPRVEVSLRIEDIKYIL